MKKFLTLLVIVSCFAPFFAGNVMAQELTINDGTGDPSNPDHQEDIQQRLNNAIRIRQKRYYNNMMEDRTERNMYYRQTRAAMARRAAHVKSSVDDALEREGPLTDWRQIRTFQEANAYRPNAKAVFRRCVVNYYYEGGACSPEELKQGVIFGSEHEVETVQDVFWRSDIDTINRIRDIQRNMPSWRQVGAGQQGVMRGARRGDSSRDFLSPFTRTYFNPEQE